MYLCGIVFLILRLKGWDYLGICPLEMNQKHLLVKHSAFSKSNIQLIKQPVHSKQTIQALIFKRVSQMVLKSSFKTTLVPNISNPGLILDDYSNTAHIMDFSPI